MIRLVALTYGKPFAAFFILLLGAVNIKITNKKRKNKNKRRDFYGKPENQDKS
jgi:hypothetical protein